MKVAIGEHVDTTPIYDSAAAHAGALRGRHGARGKNFYNDLAVSYGFDEEAAKIQDLYLGGHRAEAAALVPEAWLEAMCLAGPRNYVAERIAAIREAGVTQLAVDAVGPDALGTLDQVRTLVDA